MTTMLRTLWSLISRAHRREALALVFFLLIGAFFESLGLGIILPLIGLMTSPETIMQHEYVRPILGWLGNPDSITVFFMVLGALNAVFLITVIYRIWLSWYQTTYLNKLKVYTSVNLFNIYMRQPWRFYLQRHSAVLIQNVIKETDFITQYGYASALNLARELIFITVIGTMLVNLAPSVAIVALLSLLPLAWLFQKLSRMRIKLWAEKRQTMDAERLKCVQEGLNLVKEIKLSGRESQFVEKLESLSNAVASIERHQSVMRQLSRPVFELYAIIGISIAIIFMWRTGMELTSIAPILGLFALALLRLLPSISQILFAIHGIRYIAPAMTTIAEDIKRPLTQQKDIAEGELPFRSTICLNNVTYKHPDTDRKILNNSTLLIPHGDFVGIIGSTGAGKSTLIDIMLGLLKPDAGRVEVDGADIQEHIRHWQSQIGYVGQNIIMLDDTIRRNIALGIPDGQIDETRIWHAIEAAQLMPVMNTLTEGLDTKIGERGARLSGGERQRLGLARALYNTPTILVLDEATSSLDIESEALVMNTIDKLKGRCTILMVTHRTATLQNCDLVYRVHDGKVTTEQAPFFINTDLQKTHI